jgi:hypothetical protein
LGENAGGFTHCGSPWVDWLVATAARVTRRWGKKRPRAHGLVRAPFG